MAIRQISSMVDTEVEVLRLEDRLRIAMLRGDHDELDALIDDRLVFVGPDGLVYGKEDDLALYRSGDQQLRRLELREFGIEVHAASAIVSTVTDVEGSFRGLAFAGSYRYLRVWSRAGLEWRVIAGSVCGVAPD
jgi:hypothetical protein